MFENLSFRYVLHKLICFSCFPCWPDAFSTVIPQTCKYKGRRFECGLSISCVLAGGKPVDSCSGGMIWSCCVDKDLHQESSSMGLVQNASKYHVKTRFILCPILDIIRENYEPSKDRLEYNAITRSNVENGWKQNWWLSKIRTLQLRSMWISLNFILIGFVWTFAGRLFG